MLKDSDGEGPGKLAAHTWFVSSNLRHLLRVALSH
jgi:hypothetical protein